MYRLVAIVLVVACTRPAPIVPPAPAQVGAAAIGFAARQ